MGDFLLDLRQPHLRRLAVDAAELRFVPRQTPVVLDQAEFGLVLTYVGDPTLWAPFQDGDGSVYAVAGMVAFDEVHWAEAASVPGQGGLAAKATFRRYKQGGLAAVEAVDGNRALFVYDAPAKHLHLVSDCTGVFPAFECRTDDGWVWGSHPDIVARAAGVTNCLDEVSLTEFLLRSTVTPPFTYYERVRAVEHGTTLTIQFPSGELSRRRYYAFEYRGDERTTESALALELATALRRSVQRRTLPRLGTSAVALSGGLDSRALLACVENRDQTFAFCCYNEPNLELRVAESIARALGIRFIPLQRDFDYYGNHAEQGVRVSGGMGTFANNHFLGMLDRLHAEGMQNLLTGCYCDYLFKGLPLNRQRHWLTGRERLGSFRHEFYFEHHLPHRPVPAAVRERWESRVPREYQRQDSPAAVFQVEARRTFPLCYEGDNQQRLVPQRLTGWSLPVADREVLDVYCRIPFHYKLNRSLFLKTAQALTGDRLAGIPDANIGARLGASRTERWLAANWQRLRRKFWRSRPSIATEESWPNWHYYVPRSRKLAELWQRPNPDAFDFFRRVIGPENVSPDVRDYSGDRLFLFVSLLTLKLWFDQRGG